MHRRASEGRSVLIVAPYGRDADAVAELLTARGYEAKICRALSEAAVRIDNLVGAVLVTEEALGGDLSVMRQVIEAQPPWSSPPFVLLAARQHGRLDTPESARQRLSEFADNIVVLERPLGVVSLVSAVDSALRTRQKQFEMRDRLAELAESRQALQSSEAELRLIADSLPVLIGFVDRDLRYRFANKAYEDWLYRPVDQIIGRSALELAGEEAYRLRRPFMEMALAGKPARFQIPWPHQDGRRRDADIRYLPRRGADGQVDGFHVFASDVTDQVRTAQMLEEMVVERTAKLNDEMANRAKAEAALRQSQKMEAVGQLTGGIAHDFNNMMTGVIGALDILKRRIAAGRTDDVMRFMDAALASAHRAAGLTQRLLAFSRRQSLDSRPTDINGLVVSFDDLLTRTLGENISLKFALGADVPAAVVDANQLESAILNLVLNARDAMPEGGQLTIETRFANVDAAYAATRADLKPGRYVVVSVSDTGVGMSAALLEKVFDPFFTTKPLGQGTGLGLSMVYGFARQSGGCVRIHSKPGQGASVSLYLPVAEQAAVAQTAAPRRKTPKGRGQTVLVVEDDTSVRMLVREVLEELGYAPLEASEALQALPVLTSDRALDLMISDVGLPGMNGRELAEVARRHRPDLPILFITGYAENAAIRANFLGANMAMITKPFALDALAAKIGEMLRVRKKRAFAQRAESEAGSRAAPR